MTDKQMANLVGYLQEILDTLTHLVAMVEKITPEDEDE